MTTVPSTEHTGCVRGSSIAAVAEPVVELEHVTKRFGSTTALADVSFAAGPGEVLAILGPNGAGKSTALSVLLGLRRPDSGTARLFGGDPRVASSRREVGVTPQETGFPLTLRVQELVELVQAHYPDPPAPGEVLARFELTALARRQLGGLSGGERRRLAVALAFAGAPRVVILDEPTSGLDVIARHAVWEAILAHAEGGGAVLLTTHYLEEAELLASKVVLIDAGTVIARGTVASIKAAAGLTRVTIRAVAGHQPPDAERDGPLLRILTSDAGRTVEELVRAGVPLLDLDVRPLSLEEAIAARSPARADSQRGNSARADSAAAD